jgi:hypothetical protein
LIISSLCFGNQGKSVEEIIEASVAGNPEICGDG